jgi:hypothetical protein
MGARSCEVTPGNGGLQDTSPGPSGWVRDAASTAFPASGCLLMRLANFSHIPVIESRVLCDNLLRIPAGNRRGPRSRVCEQPPG